MYNMYALARNAHKYEDRDKRTEKIQNIEFDFLGPDTINEIFEALSILEKLTPNEKGEAAIKGWENSKRKTIITKIPQSINIFKAMIVLYAGNQLLQLIADKKINNFNELKANLTSSAKRNSWLNIGGQLIPEKNIEQLKNNIKSNKINSWDQVHQFYIAQGKNYENEKLKHAYASLLELWKINASKFTPALFKKLLEESIQTKTTITQHVFEARKKDYTNPFRKMIYNNKSEMDNVLGKIENNSFIAEQQESLEEMKQQVAQIIKKWKLP